MERYVSRKYLREKWDKLKWDMEKTLDIYNEIEEGDKIAIEDVDRIKANFKYCIDAIENELFG